MTVRNARPSDTSSFAPIFDDAVRRVGPTHYTPDQIEMWAAAARDPDAYGRRIARAHTVVAESDAGAVVGFGSLEPGGFVYALYVQSGWHRQGVGGALLNALIQHAESSGVGRLHSQASVFSLPIFLRAGFHVVGEETVERDGVRIDRTLVERPVG